MERVLLSLPHSLQPSERNLRTVGRYFVLQSHLSEPGFEPPGQIILALSLLSDLPHTVESRFGLVVGHSALGLFPQLIVVLRRS